MTPYEILVARHAKNLYKRGANKGDAPMAKRRKTHFRIVKGENMVVRMYNTDILTAYSNGDFTIDLGGYAHSSTTKASINYALGIIRQHMGIGNKSIMSLNQTVVRTKGGYYVYYDGIRFNQEGELISTPKPFEARRIDKVESKEFMDAVKASGFKNVYPLLYATCQPPEGTQTIPKYWSDYLQDADHAAQWPNTVEFFKYDTGWHHTAPAPGANYGAHIYGTYEVDNAKACWARMVAKAKQDMYNNLTTEVTRIDL